MVDLFIGFAIGGGIALVIIIVVIILAFGGWMDRGSH